MKYLSFHISFLISHLSELVDESLLSALHMHKTGVRMTNEVIRGGEVFHKAVVDVYDFDQQGKISMNDQCVGQFIESGKPHHYNFFAL